MATIKRDKNGRILFTKEMKKDYTILVPDMLPIHFNIMRHVFENAGYKIELLDTALLLLSTSGCWELMYKFLGPLALGGMLLRMFLTGL